MGTQKLDPDEWWAGLSLLERTFFRDVIGLAEDLLDNEVLRLAFNGRNFSPRLISARNPTIQPGRSGRLRPVVREPDEWWVVLDSEQRNFVRELAKIIKELGEHANECLEIQNLGNGFRASHVVKFKAPTGGRAEVN